MGITSWRNASALLLLGVALVGCNSGPEKQKQFGSAGTPTNGGLNNTGLQNQWGSSQFPVAKQPNNLTPLNTNQPNQPNLGINGTPNGPHNAGFVNGVGAPPPLLPKLPNEPAHPGVRTTTPPPPPATNFGVDSPANPNFGPANPIQPPAGFQR